MKRRDFIKSTVIGGSVLGADLFATAGKAASGSSAQSQAMQKYPHLFSPIRIANVTFNNRILCAPMLFGFYALGKDSAERVYKIVEDRAKGGVAEVVVGETPINYADASSEMLPGLEVDHTKREGPGFEAYKGYADVIKKHGAIANIEIFHGGIRAGSPTNKEKHAWGPMAYVSADGVIVDPFDADKMKKVCDDFATCADFMKAAGFDGICVHGGHGYLFTQFLSPTINQRTDEYGGSVTNRGRFPREILSAIRRKVGPDFIVELRINGADCTEGGTTADQTAEFCSTLDGLVDIIHITSGLHEKSYETHTFSSHYDPHGVNVERAAIVKKKTKIPVTVVGGINSPEYAERIIADGKVDFVSLGRELIADPDFANKTANGKEDEIRRCLRCYHCYGGGGPQPSTAKKASPSPATMRTLGGMLDGVEHCTINPRANHEVEIDKMPAAQRSRDVLVVGGGPGGMQAAIAAYDRGHKVTLVEKDSSLGGVIRYADGDVHKVDLKNFKDLLIRLVGRRKINVQLNTEATPVLLAKSKADAVILAIGASPNQPSIPGIGAAIHALETYNAYGKVGKKVVLIGGNKRGCETAIYLADKGHDVIVVEMQDRLVPEIAGGTGFSMDLAATLDQINKRCNIVSKIGTRCVEITPQSVKVETQGKSEVINCDTIVYSMGMRAKRPEVEKLRAAAAKAIVFEVGDCIRGATVYEAVNEGFMAAMKIG